VKITIDTNEENLESLQHSLKMLEALIAAKQGVSSRPQTNHADIFDSNDSFISPQPSYSEQPAQSYPEQTQSSQELVQAPQPASSPELFSMFNQPAAQQESTQASLPEPEQEDWEKPPENVKIFQY
jgi:hypothetical protein